MKKTFLLIILFASLVGVASAATAGQLSYTPLEPFSAWDAKAGAYDDFAKYINTIFKLLITLGSLFAVVMLVVAGIGYMVSEAAIDIQKAKDRAVAALWGLLLLTGCWLVLNTINPNLLNFNLNIPMAPGGTYTGGSSGGSTSGSPSGSGVQPSNTPVSDAIEKWWSTPGQSSDPMLQAAANNLNCQFTAGCIAGKVGLGYSVTNGQVFDRTEENTDAEVKLATDFAKKCQDTTYGGKIKFISGDDIGVPGKDVQICYH